MTTAPASDWYPDPTGRHQLRYWDGQSWTSYVADAGVQAEDPMPEPGETAEQAGQQAGVQAAESEQPVQQPATVYPGTPTQPAPPMQHRAEELADLTLRVTPQQARDAVARELTARGFRLHFTDDWNAVAEKGTKAGNVVLGGWAQYFRFTVQILSGAEGTTIVRLLRDPVGYWGGVMGRARVSGTFKTVVNDLVTAFHSQGLLVNVDHQG